MPGIRTFRAAHVSSSVQVASGFLSAVKVGANYTDRSKTLTPDEAFEEVYMQLSGALDNSATLQGGKVGYQPGVRGVLVVGPNPGFLRYIGEVLPSLGETDVDAPVGVPLRLEGLEAVRARMLASGPDCVAAIASVEQAGVEGRGPDIQWLRSTRM